MYTIDSAPYQTYRLAEQSFDSPSHAKIAPNSLNHDYRSFRPETEVTPVDGYQPNSLWRALVRLTVNGQTPLYFLAR